MANDFELLREHVEHDSDDAFRALVERHARMVYGTAWRVLGNATCAEEVSQAVFVLLARKAASIRRGTVLAGWLYRTARFVALESLRSETRRRERHGRLAEMNDATDPFWLKVSPILEDVMARLGETDRNAVVLRFFEDKSFVEVAEALGTTEAAAKMRVARAVEKLRGFLAREGIAVPAAVLATALLTNTAPAAPHNLVNSISSVALAEGPATHESLATLVKGALKIMAWNKVRNTAVALALILLLGGGAALLMKSKPAMSPVIAVRTFEPMAGEWEGTFEMSGDGVAQPTSQGVVLSVRAPQGGRACQIEMRLIASNGHSARVFRFTHSLNERGDRIITLDDPNIARPLGEGVVTASEQAAGNVWRAGFHAALPDGSGSTDCEWSRRGDELTIVRKDRTATAEGEANVISNLRLRKVGTARL